MRKRFKEYHDIFTGNVIASNRMKGVGILTNGAEPSALGCTGRYGRASGWHNDVRKRQPYAAYDRVEFKEIVRTEGDSYARYMEPYGRDSEESLNIIEQLIDNIPENARLCSSRH